MFAELPDHRVRTGFIPGRKSPDLSSLFQEQMPRYMQVLSDFANLATNPPGNDPSLHNFYEASFNLGMGRMGNRTVPGLLLVVLDERKDIKPRHLANLFFRGVQYIELFHSYDGNYLQADYKTIDWESRIKQIMGNERKKSLLKNLLLTRNTTTTIYQRYASSAAALRMVYGDAPLNIADLGCGGNHGLPAFELGKQFEQIEDYTPQSAIDQAIQKLPRLQEGLAVDVLNPIDTAVRLWRLACSFYPQELKNFPNLIQFEQELTAATKTRFMQADILNLPIGENGSAENKNTIPSNNFDAVILSTVMYQMNTEQRLQILENAKRLLKKDGIIVVQDFAVIDESKPCGLNFNITWYSDGYSYRTFLLSESTDWQPQEFLKWNDGRCTKVQPGEHFEYISRSTRRAA